MINQIIQEVLWKKLIFQILLKKDYQKPKKKLAFIINKQ